MTGGTQSRYVWRRDVLHFVDEQRDPDAQVGGDRRGVGEQLGQVDFEVPGIGATPRGGHVDAQLNRHRGALGRLRVAERERLEHGQELLDTVGRAMPRGELTHRHVQGGRDRAPDRLLGPRLDLPGAPQPLHRHRPERVEQHGLADAAQARQHHAAFGPPARHAFQDDLELADLTIAPGQLRRPLASAGGIRVPYRVHSIGLYDVI